MTQSSCRSDTKSKSHSGMKLAPVRVFSCKHPITRSPWGTLNLYHIPSFKMIYIYITAFPHLNTEKQHTWVSHSRDKRHQTRGSKLHGFFYTRPRFNGLWSRKPRISNRSFSIRDAKILIHRLSKWQSLSIANNSTRVSLHYKGTQLLAAFGLGCFQCRNDGHESAD